MFIDGVDMSVEADAERLRWLLDGNGYWLEENYIRGSDAVEDRRKIDEAMSDGGWWQRKASSTDKG